MTTALIITSNLEVEDATFDVNLAGYAARKDTLELCQSFVAVTNDAELADAVAAASMARELVDACAMACKPDKGKLALATKRLRALEGGFSDALTLEKERLNTLASAYVTTNAAAERRALEAEKTRIAEATAAAVESGDTDALRELATAQHALAVKPAAAGALVREKWDYEVESIRALYDAFPALVKVEPKRALILAAIADGQGLPGIRIFQAATVYAQ